MTQIDEQVSRSALLRDPLLVGAAGVGAVALLHVRDPHEPGSWGLCPFLVLTGQPCPGCGGLRAVNLLSRGDVVGAISSNVLAVVMVVVLAVAWLLWIVRRARGIDGRMIVLTTRVAYVIGAVAVLFWVARLTPWGAWLAP